MQMKNPFTLISTINAMSKHDGFREGLYAKERDTRGWYKAYAWMDGGKKFVPLESTLTIQLSKCHVRQNNFP